MLYNILMLIIIGQLKIVVCKIDCELPEECSIITTDLDTNIYGYEKTKTKDPYDMMYCSLPPGYKFKFDASSSKMSPNKKCFINNKTNERDEEIIALDWPKNRQSILDKSFNFRGLVVKYARYFHRDVTLSMAKLKGFEVNLMNDNVKSSIIRTAKIKDIILTTSGLNFYIDGKLVKNCQDLKLNEANGNLTIRSIFQIERVNNREVIFDSCQFKQAVCPLVFKKTYIDWLYIVGMIDTFYKRNVLAFTTDSFADLDAFVQNVEISKAQNIRLDQRLFNPSVFRYVKRINVGGFVDSVSAGLFRSLESLTTIQFQSTHFRNLVHKVGIKWIKQINRDIQANMSVRADFIYNLQNIKYVFISCTEVYQEESIDKVFPDEDFCIYVDFPFRQLVLLMQYCSEDYIITIIKNTKYLSCTYLWLTQYLTVYSHILNTDRSEIIKTIIMLINSLPYKNNASCNFERRFDLCSRSKFTIKDIWSKSDYYIFNKKLQIALKILTYLTSLSSIVTNILVIVTILKKGNNELYKGLKQYSYLYLNSVFSLLISSIMILSWTTECFYPFELFCPEFRKLVFFQYFKILFRECFVTAFKFMCNFCYIAFAVNRISLLGKDHGSVVTFISEVGIKKYLLVAFLVSLVLSVVKFFKYEINLYNDELNFPTSNEMDIFTVYNKRSKEAALFDAFFIINSISDVINYVVLVLVCFSIDISMVVQLRNVLAEKLAKYAAMTHNESKIESKKEENEKIVSKAVKMVVINTAVGVLFKAPLCFIPIVNVYAEFYYKSPVTRYIAPKFGEFYSGLFDTGFYETVIALADLFYMISITIQLFIFIRFDKKFKQGFDKLRKAENKKAQQGKCDNPSIISKKGTK